MAKVALRGTAIHTNGNLPAVGSKAPDFTLVDGELRDKTLNDFKGKRKLLSIVPSLDTGTCSLSAKKFNETAKAHPEVSILVISCDLPFAQKRLCSTEKLENIHTLSMMRSKDFAINYGVLLIDGPLAGIAGRAVVVLDENDKVLYSQLVDEISQEPDYQKALEFLVKR